MPPISQGGPRGAPGVSGRGGEERIKDSEADIRNGGVTVNTASFTVKWNVLFLKRLFISTLIIQGTRQLVLLIRKERYNFLRCKYKEPALG